MMLKLLLVLVLRTIIIGNSAKVTISVIAKKLLLLVSLYKLLYMMYIDILKMYGR